ncbi:MAG: hypothetical protein IKO41_09005 [Lachnospiraceae bacterium]|nr:hypothetical protein [Lachnospiraceae bacterium]
MKKENLIKKMPEETLPAILLGASLCFAAASSVTFNPDTDAWWLTATGKVLWESGFVRGNPFCMVKGLSFTAQQTACCLLNYLAECLFGMNGLWTLAVLFNMAMLASALVALSAAGAGRYRKFLVLATLEFAVARAGLVTTRPYQVTMAITFLALSAWIKWSNGKRGRKETAKALAVQATLTVLQANFQSSSLVLLLLWPICFTIPGIDELVLREIREENPKKIPKNLIKGTKTALKTLLPAWIVTAAASLLNPYGISGAVYLIKSAEAVKTMSRVISEMKEPTIFSFQTLLLMLLAALSVASARNKGMQWIPYLAAGSAVLAASYNRNAWILMVAAAVASGAEGRTEKTDKKNGRVMPRLLAAAGLALGIAMAAFLSKPVTEPEAVKFVQNAINEGERVRLMTAFGTGGYFEHAGMPSFVDARLELTSKGVSGTEIMEEWYAADVQGYDPEGFVQKYDFNYLATQPATGYLGYYAKHSDDWELVAADEKICLYRKIR